MKVKSQLMITPQKKQTTQSLVLPPINTPQSAPKRLVSKVFQQSSIVKQRSLLPQARNLFSQIADKVQGDSFSFQPIAKTVVFSQPIQRTSIVVSPPMVPIIKLSEQKEIAAQERIKEEELRQLQEDLQRAQAERQRIINEARRVEREKTDKLSAKLQTESPIEANVQSGLIKQDKAYDLEQNLIFEVKSLHKHVKLSGDSIVLPIMVSVKTLEIQEESDNKNNHPLAETALEPAKLIQQEELSEKQQIQSSRPTLDLVCVLDISSSMNGEKIENLKSTLIQLIDMLNESDRLSLITFNSQGKLICNLVSLTAERKSEIKELVKAIKSSGGTSIMSGMKIALDLLSNRVHSNQVTSIFLLSDGQDRAADSKIQSYLNLNAIGQQCFTIHSFGFGSDHDGPLMTRICDLRDGNFYYIEKISQVDEYFVDALGGLFSVVAQEVEIQVKLNNQSDIFKKYLAGTIISKTFGNMWKNDNNNAEGISYGISIKQLFEGISKDFIFEVTIPASQGVIRLEDFERNIELIQCELTAIPVDIKYSTKIVKSSNLMLTLYAKDEIVAEDSEVNDNVEFNYLRVQAAIAMEKTILFSEQRQFQLGQEALDCFLQKIEHSHPKNKGKLEYLKKEVEECKKSAMPEVYGSTGKYKLLSKKEANFKQTSQGIEEQDLYQNKMQKMLVQTQKKSKC